MANNEGQDRRFDDRTQVSLLVRLKFPRVEDFRYRYTKDISKGGIFLLANVARPIGTPIVVHLLPPGDEVGLELVGEVAYIVTPDEAKAAGRAPGMGVRFINLTNEKRRAIEGYLVGRLTSLAPEPAFDPSRTIEDEGGVAAQFARPSFDEAATEPSSRLPDGYLEADAREQLERIKNCSYYDALGLTPSTRTIDVRRAYLALTKRYHPDNYFRRASKPLIATLEELYERLTEAYETLSSPEKRAPYDAKIGVGRAPETTTAGDSAIRKAAAEPPRPMQVQQAMVLVMDARKAIRAGNPTEAVHMLRSAVSFDPSNDDARTLLQKLLRGGTR